MDYSWFLARRLSLASGNRKSSPAIKVSVAAVALSVAVMLASIAIVIGFKREIREKVVGFNSHITLYAEPSGTEGDNIITLTPSLEQELSELPFITDYSLEASVPAILKTPDNFKGVYLRSLNGEELNAFLKSNLEEGTIPDFSRKDSELKVVISRSAASKLGLKTGDRIDTYFITDNVRVRRLEISGIYNSHFDTYDDVLIYGSLALIQHLGGLSPNQGTSMQVHTDNFGNLEENTMVLHNHLVEALAQGRLYKFYRAENAISQGASYFQWLSLLDTNVVVVLALMTVVAVATLISGMLIIILDKRRFIGLVRALGAPVGKVRKVFVYLAIKVALYGLAIGNILMLTLLYCQDRWHFIPLDPEAYYIDFVPVEISWVSVVILNVGILAVIYLSLILPSRFVAKISPAETIRTAD